MTSEGDETSLYYPNNEALGMETAMRAAESALNNNERSKLSSWLAVDSVP